MVKKEKKAKKELEKEASVKPPKKVKSKTVEDRGLINSLLFLKEINSLPKSSQVTFDTVREAEDAAKEIIVDAVHERLATIKQEISDLQKKNYHLKLEGIKLIKIPLKLRVWLSNTSRKELEAIFDAMGIVSKKLEPLKKESEEREAEKDRLEKLASERELKESEETKDIDQESPKEKTSE